MKILYAASNNANSKLQLSRFLRHVPPNVHLKIAAYKNSSPPNINIDWTLDCLLNIYKPNLLSLHNDNLSIYYDQIKNYAPDLIISDLEYFTSYIAGLLDITIWQCSSSIINFAISKSDKYNLGLFKHHAFLLNRDPLHTQRIINLLDNSNGNFVYSHFGELDGSPSLLQNYEWIRPYHQVGKNYIPCQHYIVARTINSNVHLLDTLKHYSDSVIFSDFIHESYHNVLVKQSILEDEYYCNIANSQIFICDGQTNLLADGFYNNKYSLILPDFKSPESVINSVLSEQLQLGKIVSHDVNFSDYTNRYIEYKSCDSIKYLHEKIEEII